MERASSSMIIIPALRKSGVYPVCPGLVLSDLSPAVLRYRACLASSRTTAPAGRWCARTAGSATCPTTTWGTLAVTRASRRGRTTSPDAGVASPRTPGSSRGLALPAQAVSTPSAPSPRCLTYGRWVGAQTIHPTAQSSPPDTEYVSVERSILWQVYGVQPLTEWHGSRNNYCHGYDSP